MGEGKPFNTHFWPKTIQWEIIYKEILSYLCMRGLQNFQKTFCRETFSVRGHLMERTPVFICIYYYVSSITFTFYPISICSLKAAGSQPSRTHT